MIMVYQLNTRSINPIGWIIKFFQKTKYSHYAIQLDQDVIIDAGIKGVKLHGMDEFFKKYKIHRKFMIPTLKDFKPFIDEYLNRPYSYISLFGLLLKNLKITKSNPFKDKNKALICSELVVCVLRYLYNIKIKDQDSFDLNRTEKLLEEYALYTK